MYKSSVFYLVNKYKIRNISLNFFYILVRYVCFIFNERISNIMNNICELATHNVMYVYIHIYNFILWYILYMYMYVSCILVPTVVYDPVSTYRTDE